MTWQGDVARHLLRKELHCAAEQVSQSMDAWTGMSLESLDTSVEVRSWPRIYILRVGSSSAEERCMLLCGIPRGDIVRACKTFMYSKEQDTGRVSGRRWRDCRVYVLFFPACHNLTLLSERARNVASADYVHRITFQNRSLSPVLHYCNAEMQHRGYRNISINPRHPLPA